MNRPLSAPAFQQLSPSALRYSADWFLEMQEGRWAAPVHAALCSCESQVDNLAACIQTVLTMPTKARLLLA